MRLTPAHLDIATAALRAVLPLEHPADSILRHFFRENPTLGVNDRAFVAETVFGILRHRFFIERAVGIATPRSLLLAYLARFQGLNMRELISLVSETEAKSLTGIKSVSLEAQPLDVQAEFPVWLMEKLRNFMSDSEILDLGRSLQQAAPLDLRVNTLVANRDDVLAVLGKDGYQSPRTIRHRQGGDPGRRQPVAGLSARTEAPRHGGRFLCGCWRQIADAGRPDAFARAHLCAG